MNSDTSPFDPFESIRHIPQYYNNADSHNSALSLILTLRPEWRESKDTIEFVRFTDGITNTVCSAVPVASQEELPTATCADVAATALESSQQAPRAHADRAGQRSGAPPRIRKGH